MRSLLRFVACISAPLMAASHVGAAAPLIPPPSLRSRAVPITEGTEPPGNPPDNYSPCTTAMLTPFYYDIYAENNECRSKTTYNWDATDGKIPSTAARQEVCVCKLLIQKLQKVQVPHCTRLVNKVWCPYARLLEYEFGLCNVGTSTSPQVTEWPAECTGTPEPTNPVKTTTPSPVKTTTPSPFIITDTPSPPVKDDATTSHTGAIVGGTVAGAASVGIALTVTLRLRKRRKEKAKKHKRKSVEKDEETDAGGAGVIISEPLSPLEDSPSRATYGLADLSPVEGERTR